MASLGAILPLAALILAGWAMARLRFISPEGVKGLSTYVFMLAVPALFFRTIGKGLPDSGIETSILYAYYGGALLTYAIGILMGWRVLGLRPDGAVLLGMAGSYSNTVQIGIPVLYALLGDAGVLPSTLIIMVHSLLLIPLTILLVELGRGDAFGFARLARSTARQVFTNPLILGILAGLAWAILGLGPLPRPVDYVFGLLTQSVTPCALIALGASLPEYRITGEPRASISMSLIKLMLMPLIVYVLAYHVFVMPPLWALVATLTAAMPIGVNVFVVAKGYEARPGQSVLPGSVETMTGPVSGAVLLSTLLSLPSFAVLVLALGVGR